MPVKLAMYVANGPNGPCEALGPANPVPNATIAQWLTTVNFPPCPPNAAALPPLDPATLAVNFWRTIPLPVPRPQIPPGYAVTGKPAYLVTHGILHPTPYDQATPLGVLQITATGSYTVNWGDGTNPNWNGPYSDEGQPWPNGNIAHTYDAVGNYRVTLIENWTATWTLAGARGVLGGLHTTAVIPGFQVEQLQAVITN